MSSVVIRGGDGNRYPALVNSSGKLMVDTELSVSGINIENVTVFRDELGNLSQALVSSSSFHQKDDIYDSTGNALTSTGGALDVSVSAPDGIGISYQPPVIVSGIVDVDANGSDVTVDNAAGAAAVNIQDGGNSITVDGGVYSTTPIVVSGIQDTVAVSGLVGLNPGEGTTIGKVKITDGTYDATVADDGYLVTMSVEHHNVHEGTCYAATASGIVASSGNSKYWLIHAPNTATRVHLTSTLYVDKQVTATLLENPTVSSSGTPISAYNMDRNSVNNTSLSYYSDPTVGADGTVLEVAFVGESSKIGGSENSDGKMILKQNEDYLIKVTTHTSDTNMSLRSDWCEE